MINIFCFAALKIKPERFEMIISALMFEVTPAALSCVDRTSELQSCCWMSCRQKETTKQLHFCLLRKMCCSFTLWQPFTLKEHVDQFHMTEWCSFPTTQDKNSTELQLKSHWKQERWLWIHLSDQLLVLAFIWVQLFWYYLEPLFYCNLMCITKSSRVSRTGRPVERDGAELTLFTNNYMWKMVQSIIKNCHCFLWK